MPKLPSRRSGLYNITVEKPGFRTAQLSSVTVAVNTSTRADIRLEVGQLQETAQVRATATQLKTDRRAQSGEEFINSTMALFHVYRIRLTAP